jgi:DNA primase
MNVDAILGRLHGVRRNGSGWMALCPAHEDRNPSLSISLHDGTMLHHCHAGCSKEAVLAALKIGPRDLFS